MSKLGMQELIIHRYQAETIENALRLAIRTLDSRNKNIETAMDREILLAEKHIKKVLEYDPIAVPNGGTDTPEVFQGWEEAKEIVKGWQETKNNQDGK